MPGKGIKRIAKDSLELRLKIWGLVQKGKPENEALIESTPGDSNRGRKINLWKTKGLWPPPEAGGERSITVTNAEGDSCDTAQDTVPIIPKEVIKSLMKMFMEDAVVTKRPQTAPRRPSTLRTVLIAARFPEDLVKELRSLEDPVSHTLEKAARVYLKLLKKQSDDSELFDQL